MRFSTSLLFAPLLASLGIAYPDMDDDGLYARDYDDDFGSLYARDGYGQ